MLPSMSFGTLARSVVIVAPLAGLLGTVSGMIETFDALADMTLFSQSGGIAGGISQALITTMAGLTVGIPALIAYRWVLARADDLVLERHRLEQARPARRDVRRRRARVDDRGDRRRVEAQPRVERLLEVLLHGRFLEPRPHVDLGRSDLAAARPVAAVAVLPVTYI